MGKRLVFAAISAAMGSLVGLLFAFVTGRNVAIVICAIIGAILSFCVKK